MKKTIALGALVLLLAGCGKAQPEITETIQPAPPPTTRETVQETTQPVPTEPPTQPGTIRAEVGGLYKTLSRGEKVTVIGSVDGHYVVSGEEDFLVDEAFLRLSTDADPALEPVGYAKYNTKVFDNPRLAGEPIATLWQNTKLEILEGKGDWLMISWEAGTGYIPASQSTRWPAAGGGGGGDDGGSNSSGGSSGGQDGSDVDLGSLSNVEGFGNIILLGGYSGPKFTEMAPTEGKILADNTEGYLTLWKRGEQVKVTEAGKDSCTLYLDGKTMTIPRWAVSLETDAPYTAWQGYTRWNTRAYGDIHQTKEIKSFYTNQKVEIVDELSELKLYVVSQDGEPCYIPVESVSKTPYAVYSDSGSDSDGGGGSSGGDWTPPAL